MTSAQAAPPQEGHPNDGNLLARRYKDGESLCYHMKATNRGHSGTIQYEADAKATVAKNTSGSFLEEYSWSGLSFNGQAVTLPAATAEFRQPLSLDPAVSPSLPDLSHANPMLIGPMADLLTFYADLWLAVKQGTLKKPGDHAYVKYGSASSWADGIRTLIGQDSIDFDLTLAEVNARVAKLVVRHVPPAQSQIRIPTKWMEAPVADTSNNWIEVSKTDSGKYLAEIGKEIFDVELTVDLGDGKILSATMDNPVSVLGRECVDAELTNCGEAQRYEIRRQIELQFAP